MNRVIAVVEGQTEQTFIRDLLAPFLGHRGVMLTARLVGRPGHKGGVGPYERARNDLLALLKQEQQTIVTSMFDYYGMPDSWPGRQQARRVRHDQKALTVEQAIKEDVASQLGSAFDGRRLMPYVQMHEFEALLFSQPAALCRAIRQPGREEELTKIRDGFASPEEINDDPNTAPSKRIEALYPAYQKVLHGTLAAKQVTVEVMRGECPHFNDWVSVLEGLASTGPQ